MRFVDCRCTGRMVDKEHPCSLAEAAAVGDSYLGYYENHDMFAGNEVVAGGWGTEALRSR